MKSQDKIRLAHIGKLFNSARIYGSPTGNINSKKELFQIPSGYYAVIVLRIGNVDKSVDAVSAATPRKKFEEVVN